MKGDDEWTYFREQIVNFQRGAGNSDEAGNYSAIQFSAFAEHWNEWVASLGFNKPAVTYKSASHLQDGHKTMQKWARRASTVLPHAGSIDNLRQTHTSSAANQPFVNQFVVSENPTRTRPPTMQTRSTQTADILDDDDVNPPDTLETPAELARSAARGKTSQLKRSAPNAKPRCRRCGKRWLTQGWIDLHENRIPDDTNWSARNQNRFLRHGEGNNVWDHCRVAESDFERGFPCYEGSMPRIKKKKDGNN